jgi:hypothetical protein
VFSVENYALSLSTSTLVPAWVVQKEICSLYTAHISFDAYSAGLITEPIDQMNIEGRMTFNVNNDILSNAEIDADQKQLNTFISEVQNERENFNFEYSNNSNQQNQHGNINLNDSVYINSKTGSIQKQCGVHYALPEYIDVDTPINKLIEFQSGLQYRINKYKIKFLYSTDGSDSIKTFEHTQSSPIYSTGTLSIRTTYCTTYDAGTSQVVESINGEDGFYIAESATGLYELELEIQYKENLKVFKFTNSFSFISPQGDSQPALTVKELLISNIEGYEYYEC